MLKNGVKAILAASIMLAGWSLTVLPARANLIGDTVTVDGIWISPGSATVGAGIEFSGVAGYINFDFDASSLTITNDVLHQWAGFGNYVFSGFDDIITGVSIAENTGFSGTIIDNYSFTSNTLTLDMQSGFTSPGAVLVFDINTIEPVPEPSNYLLLGTGLVGFAGLMRLRGKRS